MPSHMAFFARFSSGLAFYALFLFAGCPPPSFSLRPFVLGLVLLISIVADFAGKGNDG